MVGEIVVYPHTVDVRKALHAPLDATELRQSLGSDGGTHAHMASRQHSGQGIVHIVFAAKSPLYFGQRLAIVQQLEMATVEIGRASCRERGWRGGRPRSV